MSDDEEEYKQVIEDRICEECGSMSFTHDQTRGEHWCNLCGTVCDAFEIDYGKEWRVFSDGEGRDAERTGMPKTNLLHDKGLTTDIDWRNRDYSGAPLSGDMAKRINRLRTQHQRTRVRNATERNLVLALGELDRLAGQMALPMNIREEAAYIYRKAVEKKLVRGRSIEGVVAASLHAACRLAGTARTLDEIGQHSKTGRKEIGRTFRSIQRELGLRIRPSSPEEYIPRFCTDLHLPVMVESKALTLLSDANSANIMAGRGPTGIAAAAIYLAGILEKNKRTQKEVSQVAGVTEVTIRNRFKEICKALDLDTSKLT